jgi:hypothetical protein
MSPLHHVLAVLSCAVIAGQGTGFSISSKACRWVLVGSTRIAMPVVPGNRTSFRVRVARWSSRPRKLREGRPARSSWHDALAWACADRWRGFPR